MPGQVVIKTHVKRVCLIMIQQEVTDWRRREVREPTSDRSSRLGDLIRVSEMELTSIP